MQGGMELNYAPPQDDINCLKVSQHTVPIQILVTGMDGWNKQKERERKGRRKKGGNEEK